MSSGKVDCVEKATHLFTFISAERWNGQQALLELVNKFEKVTDEVIRSTIDKLVKTTMNQAEDPDNYFMEALARAELEKMGEPISDRRFKGICVQGYKRVWRSGEVPVGTVGARWQCSYINGSSSFYK